MAVSWLCAYRPNLARSARPQLRTLSTNAPNAVISASSDALGVYMPVAAPSPMRAKYISSSKLYVARILSIMFLLISLTWGLAALICSLSASGSGLGSPSMLAAMAAG